KEGQSRLASPSELTGTGVRSMKVVDPRLESEAFSTILERQREQHRSSQFDVRFALAVVGVLLPLAVRHIHKVVAGQRANRGLVRHDPILVEHLGHRDALSLWVEMESHDPRWRDAVLYRDERSVIQLEPVGAH